MIPGANLVEVVLLLIQAKKFVEAAPKVIRENVSKEEALKMKATLEAVGATVTMDQIQAMHVGSNHKDVFNDFIPHLPNTYTRT